MLGMSDLLTTLDGLIVINKRRLAGECTQGALMEFVIRCVEWDPPGVPYYIYNHEFRMACTPRDRPVIRAKLEDMVQASVVIEFGELPTDPEYIRFRLQHAALGHTILVLAARVHVVPDALYI